MAIVLTYDVDKSHTPIKQHLMSAPYNYRDTMRGTAINSSDKAVECDLPDTTLYHPTRTAAQGKADIDAAAAQFGATVEKTVTFELASPLSWRGKISRYV